MKQCKSGDVEAAEGLLTMLADAHADPGIIRSLDAVIHRMDWAAKVAVSDSAEANRMLHLETERADKAEDALAKLQADAIPSFDAISEKVRIVLGDHYLGCNREDAIRCAGKLADRVMAAEDRSRKLEAELAVFGERDGEIPGIVVINADVRCLLGNDDLGVTRADAVRCAGKLADRLFAAEKRIADAEAEIHAMKNRRDAAIRVLVV